MSASDDERISYLAGDPAGSLDANERARLDALRESLKSPATWVEPDAALEDRIVAAIAEEAKARPAAPVQGADPAEPATRPPRRRRGLNLGAIFRRPGYALGGIAGAVAAVAVAVVIASGGRSSPTPLHFAMVVSGTALAPNAHGDAHLTKTASGWRIQLAVTGLPHIENGRYYQAWLKNATGILVPVGTFNDGRDVTLWSGVPVTKFRTLTVTEQLANGNPISSGKRVLVGRITPHG